MELAKMEKVITASTDAQTNNVKTHVSPNDNNNIVSDDLIVEMNNILDDEEEFSVQDENDNNIYNNTNQTEEHKLNLQATDTLKIQDSIDTSIIDDDNENNFYLSLNIESESLNFNIQITTPSDQWTINKSFKDFQLFDTTLSSKTAYFGSNVPKIPPLHETTIQSYLLYLTLLLNKTIFLRDEHVLKFIDAPQKTILSIKSHNDSRIPIKCGKVKLNDKLRLLILNKHTITYMSDEKENKIDLLKAVKDNDINIEILQNIFILSTSEIQWKIQCKDNENKNEWIELIQQMISLIEYCQDQKVNRYHENDTNDTIKPKRETKKMKDYRIDYELFQWIWIILFTLWAVIDRYTVNLWPLWVDSPGPTIAGNFGVTVFAVIAWVSSRVMLVSSSYIFLLQCHVFFNWIVENQWVNKYIKIGDVRQSNTKLHYHVGWALVGVPVVLHVWSIIFAASFPQNSVKVYSSWMRPSMMFEGVEMNIPFYANNLLSLGMNDVYRLVSTSVSFFILIPYSVIKRCRDKNWSFAQWMHMIGAIIYTVDLLRMKSHPHCWVFNIPFILMWMCDRVYGVWWYRRTTANVVKKTQLDDQYIILYLRVDDRLHAMHTIGDVFYFNRLDCGGGDRAHPFTVFQNHRNANKMTFIKDEELDPKWAGHKFSIRNKDNQYIMKRMSTQLQLSTEFDLFNSGDDWDKKLDEIQKNEQIPDSNDWNVGIIMQVVPNHKHICYQRKTWTGDLSNIDFRYLCGLRAWGPYRSEYRILMKEETDSIYPLTPLVLIATGAGCAYLIDYYQYIVANKIKLENNVQFYFTSRSLSMFQWFTNITCDKHIDNFSVNAHLTSHHNIKYDPLGSNSNGAKTRNSAIGRMSFEEILNISDKSTQVFFCGSPFIQGMVEKHCKKLNLKYHAGHSFHA